MKRIIFIFIAIICNVGLYGQSNSTFIDILKNDIFVINETSCNKNTEYANAKEWIAKTFGDYNSVVKLDDNENKKIILKGRTEFLKSTNDLDIFATTTIKHLLFTMTIECKDLKYRVGFSDLSVESVKITTGLLSGTESTKTSLYEECNQDSTAWYKRAAICERELKDLEAIDLNTLKKKEKNNIVNKIAELKQRIKDEISSATHFMENNRKNKVAIEQSLSNLIFALDSMICKNEDW